MGLIFRKIASFEGENKVSNKYFESFLDTNDSWIKKRTGIEERNFTDLKTSELMVEALKKLKLSEEEKDKIKIILASSVSSDYVIPSLAAIAHGQLGLKEEVFSADINMACAGSVGGLLMAEKMLEKGQYGLCIGVEKLSSLLDFNDRSTAIIFGDGAAVYLVEKTDEKIYENFGTISSKDLDLEKDGKIKMNGQKIFKFASGLLDKEIDNFLEKSNKNIENLDHIVLHQANKRIMEALIKKVGHRDKFYSNIEKFGNTSSASVGMCLAEMKEKNILKSKDRILLIAFGGGLTYVSMEAVWG